MGNMAWDPKLTAQGPTTEGKTWDPQAEAAAAIAAGQNPFLIGGGVQNIPGGVAPRDHELEENSVERVENKKMMKRRLGGTFYKYPQLLHKAGGLFREVKSDVEFEDAIAKGWKENINDVDELEPAEAPTRVHHMTVKQGLAHVASSKHDAAKLVEIRADEQSGGNRKAILDALAEAEDAFGFPGMNVRDAKVATPAKAKTAKAKK